MSIFPKKKPGFFFAQILTFTGAAHAPAETGDRGSAVGTGSMPVLTAPSHTKTREGCNSPAR